VYLGSVCQLLLFFHVPPANQPTIMGVDLCHKQFGDPWVSVYTPVVYILNHTYYIFRHIGAKMFRNKICRENRNMPTPSTLSAFFVCLMVLEI
jgi:hypothetical protein